MSFKSHCIQSHARLPARVMEFSTPHGVVHTPAFMPVGTRACVNHMSPEELAAAGSKIILGGNTYHMLCAPGMDIIEHHGGMHPFMNWPGPMLTDSGGFQVFSLSKNSNICTIDENGAKFLHPSTQKTIELNANTSIQAQHSIGADIIMAFDQCTPEQGDKTLAIKAMQRTKRWLAESINTHQRLGPTAYGYQQALFGIIQGGSYQDLREQSTQDIVNADVDGIAIGGEVIGFDMQKTEQILDWVVPELPDNKIRYTMGVGLHPEDLIRVVALGVDIFDCVAPTRNARHGALYHGRAVPEGDWLRFDEMNETGGRLHIRKAIYANDESPLLENCECYTCQHYSRAYLHFLFKTHSVSYSQLACIHNIFVMHHTCNIMQKVIYANAQQ